MPVDDQITDLTEAARSRVTDEAARADPIDPEEALLQTEPGGKRAVTTDEPTSAPACELGRVAIVEVTQ